MENSNPTWSGPIFALEGSTGLGKTQTVLQAAVGAVAAGQRVAIAVSTHKLADELVKRLGDTGICAHSYRGLTAPDPLAPDEKMCRHEADGSALRAGGGNINLLCKACKDQKVCGYQRQMSHKNGTDVWVIPHNLLGHARPNHTIKPIDLLIVDETPVFALLSGFDSTTPSISVRELDHRYEETGGPWVRKALAEKIRSGENGEKVKNLEGPLLQIDPSVALIPAQSSQLERLRLVEFETELGGGRGDYYAAEVLRQLRKFPSDDIGQALINAQYNARLLLEAPVYRLIENGGHGLRIIELKTADGVPERRLEVRRKLNIKKDWRVATLLLDATPDWEVYRQYWPIEKIEVAEAASVHMKVRQVTWTASKTKLKTGPHAGTNLARLRRYIEARAAGYKSVLVVSQKAVREALVSLGLPSHVETAHFNAIRGLDRWKNVDLLIVVGRTEPPPQAVELLAEVIFQEDINMLPVGEYYPHKPVGLTGLDPQRDGPAVKASYHPDARAERVRWLINEAELLQAIGRARGLRRTKDNPLQIDIINTVSLPQKIDEVMSWQDAQPSLTDVISGRYGLLLDPAARYINSAIRALLPDAAGSNSTLQRATNSALSNHLPNKEFSISKWPLKDAFSEGRLFVGSSNRASPVRFRRRILRKLRPGETVPPKAATVKFCGATWVYEPFGPHGTFDPPLYLTKTFPSGHSKRRK